MFPERCDANRIAVPAQSPRLFGVPVPARAFGFALGWQLDARCWSTIDLRERRDSVPPLTRTVAAKAKRGNARAHRKSNTLSTTESEVAAA